MTARRRLDPTLYLVTDPDLCRGRAMSEIVVQAARGGVTFVQLRDKQAGGKALLDQARELRQVLDPLGIPLIVNDRVDVALAAGAGCHVGQTDLPAPEARALLGKSALLGLSLDQVEQARRVEPGILDYIAFGPFAATGTKADAGAPVGAQGIGAVRPLTTLPLVAIGGIDARSAGAAIEAGADGVAVVSAIMAAPDPEAAARELRGVIEAALRRRRKEEA
jgi:thiamine-phosphate pyrophosphorylase